MNEQEILSRLKKSIERNTPDLVDSILAKCEKENRSVIEMSETREIRETGQKTKKKRGKLIGGLAAACLLLAVGITGYQQLFSVASVVGIDVNPSIELSVSKNLKVRNAEALNSDAETILSDMDLKGVDLDVAVNAIVGSMVKNGYVDEVKNSVLVSVEGKDSARNASIQEQVSSEIDAILKGLNVSGAVIGQTIINEKELQKKADEYGISVGKAALIQKIVNTDVSKTFDSLAGASINELNLLAEAKETTGVEKVGNVSKSGYIGEERALEIAFADAGVDQSKASRTRIHLDYDDGLVVYEIEFVSGGVEYEYEIAAADGRVLERKREKDDDIAASSAVSSGNGNSSAISEERAKEIALDHQGLSAGQVEFTKIKYDYDDGRAQYDIDFIYDNVEYEYEIDAETGKITDYDRERVDDGWFFSGDQNNGASRNNSTDGKNTASGTQQGNSPYIGEERAQQIAFADAGITSADFVEVEFDYDDGIAEYSVEFRIGNLEYEYEIDAVTGAILKSEVERD